MKRELLLEFYLEYLNDTCIYSIEEPLNEGQRGHISNYLKNVNTIDQMKTLSYVYSHTIFNYKK